MKPKIAPEEFRMSADEFDKMMRGALSAPEPKKTAPKTKRPSKRKRAPKGAR